MTPEEYAKRCWMMLDVPAIYAPDGPEAFAAVFREAVVAERERCAELAIKMGEDDPHTWAYEFSRDLAQKIREGK